MKRLLVAVLLVALFATVSFAGVQDFGKFTMDIADGWTAAQSGPTAVITKNDNSVQLAITLSETGGYSLKDIAAALVGEFEKQNYYESITTPKADADGDYSFKAIAPNGVNVQVMLTGDEDEYLAILMTGPDDVVAANRPEMGAMISSMQGK